MSKKNIVKLNIDGGWFSAISYFKEWFYPLPSISNADTLDARVSTVFKELDSTKILKKRCFAIKTIGLKNIFYQFKKDKNWDHDKKTK